DIGEISCEAGSPNDQTLDNRVRELDRFFGGNHRAAGVAAGHPASDSSRLRILLIERRFASPNSVDEDYREGGSDLGPVGLQAPAVFDKLHLFSALILWPDQIGSAVRALPVLNVNSHYGSSRALPATGGGTDVCEQYGPIAESMIHCLA